MKIYLVGGAVRDKLLGLPVTERDWVVVGATPQDMLDRGFVQVGKDFPVFIEPVTGEEYALARTERKAGRGYTGFTCFAEPSVTLEDDLLRRDLTINAIAMDADGNLIDPYGGQADLHAKCLRHVSPAFAEDPLRVLRLARFAATFPDFQISPDTLTLCKHLVDEHELETLAHERVWVECEKALRQPQPRRFFECLQACGALPILFHDIANGYADGADMFVALDALGAAAQAEIGLPYEAHCLPAISRTDIAVGVVYAHVKRPLAHHPGMSRTQMQLATLASTWFACLSTGHITAASASDLLTQCDAFRRPHQLYALLSVFTLCASSKNDQTLLTLITRMLAAYQHAAEINAKPFIDAGLQGSAISAAVNEARRHAIAEQFTLQ